MSDERAQRTGTTEPDLLAQFQAEAAHDREEERPPAGGPAHQVVSALVTLAIGVGGAVLAYDYGLGSLQRPGPGLWPFAICLLVIALSLALLVAGRQLTDSEAFTRASLLPLVGVATCIGLGVLLPVIGFEIPSLLLCAVWLKLLGGESWRSTAIVSVTTVAAFYFLFLYGLRIPLPHLF